MIDLRADSTLPGGRCLVGCPTALVSGTLFQIADNPRDAIGPLIRTGIATRLGVAVTGSTAESVMEELFFAAGRTWGRLVDEIWCGGVKWGSEATPHLEVGGDPFDDFNRANETPLAGNWTKVTSEPTNFNLSANTVVDDAGNNDTGYYWNPDTPNDDQFSECLLVATTGGIGLGGGVGTRASTSARTYYRVVCTDGAGNDTQLGKVVAGTFTQLAVANASTGWVGQRVRIESHGTSHRVLQPSQNNTQIIAPTSDSAIASGRWALLFSGGGGANCTLDDWRGGGFGPIRPVPSMQQIAMLVR